MCNMLLLELLVEVCWCVEILFGDGVLCMILLFDMDGVYVCVGVVLLLFV